MRPAAAQYSALVEVPVGKGVMYLSQLDLGRQARRRIRSRNTLLLNLIRCGAAYKQEYANVAAVIADEQLGKAIDAIGLQYTKAADALAAIRTPTRRSPSSPPRRPI